MEPSAQRDRHPSARSSGVAVWVSGFPDRSTCGFQTRLSGFIFVQMEPSLLYLCMFSNGL